jgi:diadenosine tetraphosphate (Ap4A) HIT family hydrolase
MDCPFCNYSEELIIKKGEYVTIGTFYKSIKPGHVVIFLNRHVENFVDLTYNEYKSLFIELELITKKIATSFQNERLYILSIGDKDSHFHFHIIPRNKEEEKLGPYIFGENGWRKNFQVTPDIKYLIEATTILSTDINNCKNEITK